MPFSIVIFVLEHQLARTDTNDFICITQISSFIIRPKRFY